MKKHLVFLILIAVSVALADKVELKPYGFIKGDYYQSMGGLESWGSPAITCTQKATGLDTNASSFTAQHSRFGLAGSKEFGELEVGAKLELDFFWVVADANHNPRMRQGFAWLKTGAFEVRFGQQWDVVAPLNPSTNNTNANLWKNGNYGFRRGQIKAIYTLDLLIMKPVFEVAIAEGAKDSKKDMDIGQDNVSGVPQFQGRFGLDFLGSTQLGISGIYSVFGGEGDYSTSGFFIDANFLFHKLFALKGEFAMGKNFSDADLFTIAGKRGINGDDIESMGYWLNVTSKPYTHLNVVLGLAQEMITSDVADGAPESNMTMYGTLIFPIVGGFSIAGEYQFYMTEVKGVDTYTGGIIDIAGKLTF
ncbi:MAG: hypothetical protein HQK83_00335 [Fibrobacteria bacterium]|nr:hypothetical protein [Fibrobacteria bacterium]